MVGLSARSSCGVTRAARPRLSSIWFMVLAMFVSRTIASEIGTSDGELEAMRSRLLALEAESAEMRNRLAIFDDKKMSSEQSVAPPQVVDVTWSHGATEIGRLIPELMFELLVLLPLGALVYTVSKKSQTGATNSTKCVVKDANKKANAETARKCAALPFNASGSQRANRILAPPSRTCAEVPTSQASASWLLPTRAEIEAAIPERPSRKKAMQEPFDNLTVQADPLANVESAAAQSSAVDKPLATRPTPPWQKQRPACVQTHCDVDTAKRTTVRLAASVASSDAESKADVSVISTHRVDEQTLMSRQESSELKCPGMDLLLVEEESEISASDQTFTREQCAPDVLAEQDSQIQQGAEEDPRDRGEEQTDAIEECSAKNENVSDSLDMPLHVTSDVSVNASSMPRVSANSNTGIKKRRSRTVDSKVASENRGHVYDDGDDEAFLEEQYRLRPSLFKRVYLGVCNCTQQGVDITVHASDVQSRKHNSNVRGVRKQRMDEVAKRRSCGWPFSFHATLALAAMVVMCIFNHLVGVHAPGGAHQEQASYLSITQRLREQRLEELKAKQQQTEKRLDMLRAKKAAHDTVTALQVEVPSSLLEAVDWLKRFRDESLKVLVAVHWPPHTSEDGERRKRLQGYVEDSLNLLEALGELKAEEWAGVKEGFFSVADHWKVVLHKVQQELLERDVQL